MNKATLKLGYQYNHPSESKAKSLAYIKSFGKEPSFETNTHAILISVGLFVARETGCSLNQSPIRVGKAVETPRRRCLHYTRHQRFLGTILG